MGKWIGKSAMVDTQGHIWLATQIKAFGGDYGVMRFGGNSWQNFTVTDGLAHDRVYDVTTDSDGFVWVATYLGVSRYDGPDWTSYTSEDGLGGDGKVYQILAAHDGKLWCTHGEKMGVSVFDGKTWTFMTKKDGLPNNMMRDMCETDDGTIWFGAYEKNTKGLVCYRNGSWLRFSSQDGLPNEDIYNIAQGSDGALWLTSFQLGIVRYQPNFDSLKVVEGTLKQPDGSPRSHVGIQVLNEAGHFRAGTVTDGNGSYRLSTFFEPYEISVIDHQLVKRNSFFFKAIPMVGSAFIAWLYFTIVWKI